MDAATVDNNECRKPFIRSSERAKQTRDPVVAVVFSLHPCLFARADITALRARGVRALECPRVLIHAASVTGRSIHTLVWHIGGTYLSPFTPFGSTFLALASLGVTGDGQRSTTGEVARFITRAFDPRRWGAVHIVEVGKDDGISCESSAYSNGRFPFGDGCY